ncbi:MAG: cytochrome c3 family protein, partial [Pyrinomonadaceae bacterium]|nr:cytochrome c3 family protein [Pyrinomonadaceae bacterium]
MSVGTEATPTPKSLRKTPSATTKPKYSEFSHDVQAHKMDCSKCHTFPSANWNKVRTGDDAFPDVTDYPKHASCVNCHKQQFFRGSRPVICSICHTNPGPRNSSRHPFPNPREIFDKSPKGQTAVSDFNIAFPHDKHIEIVSQSGPNESYIMNASWVTGRRRMAEESCAVCHKTLNEQGSSDEEYFTKPPADIGDAFWLKRGTFKSSPTGHTTCFTCHNADSGLSPAQTDCATCHTLKVPAGAADFDPVSYTHLTLPTSSE